MSEMSKEGEISLDRFMPNDANITSDVKEDPEEAEEESTEEQEETESEEDVEVEEDSDPDASDEPEEDEESEEVDEEPEKVTAKKTNDYQKRYQDSQSYIAELQRQNQLLMNQKQQPIQQQGEADTTDEDEFDFLDDRDEFDTLTIADFKKMQKKRKKLSAKKTEPVVNPRQTNEFQTAYVNSHRDAQQISEFISKTNALSDPELQSLPTDVTGKYFYLGKKMLEGDNERLKAENKKLSNQIKSSKKKGKNRAPTTGPRSGNFINKGRKSEAGKDAIDSYFRS